MKSIGLLPSSSCPEQFKIVCNILSWRCLSFTLLHTFSRSRVACAKNKLPKIKQKTNWGNFCSIAQYYAVAVTHRQHYIIWICHYTPVVFNDIQWLQASNYLSVNVVNYCRRARICWSFAIFLPLLLINDDITNSLKNFTSLSFVRRQKLLHSRRIRCYHVSTEPAKSAMFLFATKTMGGEEVKTTNGYRLEISGNWAKFSFYRWRFDQSCATDMPLLILLATVRVLCHPLWTNICVEKMCLQLKYWNRSLKKVQNTFHYGHYDVIRKC